MAVSTYLISQIRPWLCRLVLPYILNLTSRRPLSSARRWLLALLGPRLPATRAEGPAAHVRHPSWPCILSPLSWQAGLCVRPCAAGLGLVGALPGPSPFRADPGLGSRNARAFARLRVHSASLRPLRSPAIPCGAPGGPLQAPRVWRPGPGARRARGARGGPRREAGRERSSPASTAAGSPAPEGVGREAAAEAELRPPGRAFPPRPGPRSPPPGRGPDPDSQPGLVAPPPPPGRHRALRRRAAGRWRPAAAGGGHGVHRGLGGVVPAGGPPAPAGVRHLPAAEAGAPARPPGRQGAHARRAARPSPRARPGALPRGPSPVSRGVGGAGRPREAEPRRRPDPARPPAAADAQREAAWGLAGDEGAALPSRSGRGSETGTLGAERGLDAGGAPLSDEAQSEEDVGFQEPGLTRKPRGSRVGRFTVRAGAGAAGPGRADRVLRAAWEQLCAPVRHTASRGLPPRRLPAPLPQSALFPCPASLMVLRGRACLPCRVPRPLTSPRPA